jgi:DnaD/phage-associated family protein
LAWIESNQELGGHPKTKKLARKLGISVVTAVGHLHFLWWWAMDYAKDGDLSKYEAGDIADAVLWDGDEDELIGALIEARFLDKTESGGVVIHDWRQYVGKLLDKRAKDAERKQSVRNGRGVRGTSSGQASDVEEIDPGQKSDGAGTVPNLTIPNHTEPNHTKTDDDNPAHSHASKSSNLPKPEKVEKPESFYSAHKRIFGVECNPFQVEQLIEFIDKDGMQEAVIIRSMEHAALNCSSYNFKYIANTARNYLAKGVKTLDAAIAVDNEFEKKKKQRQSSGQQRYAPSGKPKMALSNPGKGQAVSEDKLAAIRAKAARLDNLNQNVMEG